MKALETGNINCNILKAKAITLNIKNNNKKKTGFGRLLVKSKKTFILAELYDNDLSKLNMKNLDDHTKLEIFKQILDDIYCLFTKEFYYTDIKQENIFYKCISGGKIKVVLGDIGSIYKKRDGGFLNFFKPDMDALISVELSDEQNNIIRKNNITDYVILVQINMIIGIVKLGTFLKFNNNELNGKILYLNNITIINFDKAYTYLNQIINKILYTNLKSKYAHTSKNLPKNKERHNERHKILFI